MRIYLRFNIVYLAPAIGTIPVEIKQLGHKSQRYNEFNVVFRFGHVEYIVYEYTTEDLVRVSIDFAKKPGLYYIEENHIVDGMTYPSDKLQLVPPETSEYIIRLAESLVHQDTLAFYQKQGF